MTSSSSDTSRRLLNQHYLVNEFSSYEALCKVWDKIVERAESSGDTQIVSFLCHTYAMQADKLRRQCGDILSYMTRAGGIPVTAAEAKDIYDRSH